jgi:hypothetical protein
MAIILISKLQIFDKGENRYVLCNFDYTTQFARNFVAKLIISFAELFQKRPFFICYFSPINQNLNASPQQKARGKSSGFYISM